MKRIIQLDGVGIFKSKVLNTQVSTLYSFEYLEKSYTLV